MKTIRHTKTLVYYDGVQVFEGCDPKGSHYVGVMIDSMDTADRFLVAKVVPDSLHQFHTGALDLKALLLEGGQREWYTTLADGSFDQPLELKAHREPLAKTDFLPDDGFVLCESTLAF